CGEWRGCEGDQRVVAETSRECVVATPGPAVVGEVGRSDGLRHLARRTISTASRRQFENKVPEKQKLFQEDNGIPVHLKGGIADALLYRATMILTVGGTAYAIYQLAVASFPKKQD
uniref:Cytochrome c oxidase subunit 7A2, mitochondrial n=1 Tax=Equus caballus TaxID=9796 RepID=A0A9L0RJM5_HORSE